MSPAPKCISDCARDSSDSATAAWFLLFLQRWQLLLQRWFLLPKKGAGVSCHGARRRAGAVQSLGSLADSAHVQRLIGGCEFVRVLLLLSGFLQLSHVGNLAGVSCVRCCCSCCWEALFELAGAKGQTQGRKLSEEKTA